MILWEDKKQLYKVVDKLRTNTHSEFYQKKFDSLSDEYILSSLPFLSREELVETTPDKRLYIPQKDVIFIGFTSGSTSNKPLISYFSSIDDYFFEPSLGVSIKRPLITYPPLNKNFGYSFIQQCKQAKHKVTPIFGDYQNLPNSAVIAKETLVDAIYATPTLAVNLGESIDRYYDSKKIKLLALSSETLTQSKKELLSKQYPNALIANLYASSEIGQFILFPCKKMLEEGKEEFHFLHNALTGLELIEKELVVTYTLNKAFPLIRYKTGDFFEVAQESCSCGLLGATLKWSGRENVDKIKISGFEIRIEDVESFFNNMHIQIGDDYQIHFYNKNHETQKIRIEIEIKNEKNDSQQKKFLKELIQNTFIKDFMLSQKYSLKQAVSDNIISDVVVLFVDELSHKTEKNRKLVNHII